MSRAESALAKQHSNVKIPRTKACLPALILPMVARESPVDHARFKKVQSPETERKRE
jgi:hypothetical protein